MNAAILTIREIAEDMPYLMARASNEGRECGQILARETREALEAAIAAFEAAPTSETEARATAAEAEVERLMAALMEIMHLECLTRPGERSPHERMQKIAARALEGKYRRSQE